jgi:putative addiction module CopG family antidote
MMNISLKPNLEKFIADQVKADRFQSADEAMNAAVAHFQMEEALSDEDLNDLRAEIDAGIAEADRSEFADFTAADIVAERLAARKNGKKAR